jgi:tetratricopeptide (TPR) repeat protein
VGRRLRAVAAALLGCAALLPGLAAAEAAPVELVPGRGIDRKLDDNATLLYTFTLADGTAADLQFTQDAGFIDLELHSAAGSLGLRTEAGIHGHIEATLLATTARVWTVTVIARKGLGPAAFGLRLSPPRTATVVDAERSAGFARYAEAEQLRRDNYRESVIDQRGPDVDARTRRAYAEAESRYAAAGDGCGLRRVRIGVSRMDVALGKYAQARAEAESALLPGCEGDLAERAQAQKTIGMAAAYQGDFTASSEAAQRALSLYEQTGDRRYQGIVLGNLSEVYMQLGATDRALAAANGALAAAQATDDRRGVVFCRKSIAAIRLARGELATALEEYRGTLAALAATPYPMIEGETWNDLGILYHRMADYDAALRAFASARSVWQEMHNRVGEADTLESNAETLLELGRTAGATADLRRALEIARADGLKSAQTRVLRGLGQASLGAGRLAEARHYFAASLAVAHGIGEIAAESYARRALAHLEYTEGHLARALRQDQAALGLVRRAADRDGEAATLAQLARHTAAAGDLDTAKRDIDAALAITETQRGRINDPSLRTSYFAAMRDFPDTEIDILMRLERRAPGKGYARAALGAAERARARSLGDLFAERSIALTRGVTPDLAAAQREAEERVRIAAFQLARADAGAGRSESAGSESAGSESAPGKADGRALRRQALVDAVDAASHALDEIRGRVRSANPRYADLLQPAALDIGDVQRRLIASDGAVLEYWLGARESTVWVVTQRAFRVLRLPPRALIERQAQALAQVLRTPPHGPDGGGFAAFSAAESRASQSVRAATEELAHTLRLRETLRGLPRQVAIVADGSLARIPFGILPERRGGAALGGGHDLSYLPSITTLSWLRGAGPDRDQSEPPSVAIFAAPAVPATGSVPLPYSRAEAESIAALLPADRRWLALGANASRAAVLAADWHRYAIVHFATHAVVDRERPELSGILLAADGDADPGRDGMLRMNDIYDLDMPVDLVVLSGCDTAAGRTLGAEGVFSLSRAFLYAGARRVIASLWPVEDRATAQFMTAFYRALLVEHMPAPTALRLAQQRLARDNRWSPPYYWAGFVLQGAGN